MSFLQRAKSRASASSQLVEPSKLVRWSKIGRLDKSGDVILPSHQAVSHACVNQLITINSANSPSFGSFMDFQVSKSSCDLIKGLALDITLANATGTQQVLVHPAFLIDRIEFRVQGGNLIGAYQGEHIYQQIGELTAEKQANYGLSYNSTVTVPANGSVNVILPLTEATFINQYRALRGFPVFTLSSDMTVRVYFDTSSKVLTTGTAGVSTIASCQLLIDSDHVPAALLSELLKEYLSGRVVKILYPTVHTETIACVAGSSKSVQLTGCSGAVAHLIFSLRPSTLAGADTVNFQKFNSYGLVSASGSYIGSSGDITYNQNKRFLCADLESNLVSQTDLMFHPFGRFPEQQSGAMVGFDIFTSQERLVFTPATTGTYALDVNAMCFYEHQFKNGTVTLHQS